VPGTHRVCTVLCTVYMECEVVLNVMSSVPAAILGPSIKQNEFKSVIC